MHELCTKSALELARSIRDRSVSSEEVVRAHLARIDEVNGTINAIVLSLADSALDAARAADNASDVDRSRPFHGVPFTIKENLDLLGTPTTSGVPSMADAMPSQTAPVVARMIGAGAVPLGRTNLPEMGARLDTDNPLRGRTYNPWNPKLTPGGSSGGDAAAIATGMTPFGIGNDIGGSLRNPAYCCGIASLKPSAGRLPLVMSVDPFNSMMAAAFLSDGPMARSVADLRAGLTVMAGRHIDDPQSLDVPLTGPLPDRLTAAMVTEIPGYTLPAATLSAIDHAGECLRAAGWAVEEVEPPELDRVNEIWGKVLSSGGVVDDLSEVLKPETAAYMRDFTKIGDIQSLQFEEALDERRRLQRVWSHFFGEHNVVVGPVWTRLPWPIDSDLAPGTGAQLLFDTIRFIAPGNVLGIPGVALPMGVDDGLPTGVQVYADLYRDDLALMAAEAIEAARGPCPTPIDPVLA